MKHLVSFFLLVAGTCLSAHAQDASPTAAGPADRERPPALDLREEVRMMRVTVKDMFRRTETKDIPVTIYRPVGDEKHPLVIFNHGRATASRIAMQGRSRPEQQARWLVKQGFVVLAPTRVGYADTLGDFDPEFSGSCQSRRLEPKVQAAVDQVLATVELARTLPYVDVSRWVVIGQSVGGQAAVATVGASPPGLLGGINFSGGSGGNPEQNPGSPCGAPETGRYWGKLAEQAKAPMQWIYWENDLYWGAKHPKAWSQAWAAGGGQVEFHQLPASGKDGHAGINQDMDHWAPLAGAFLSKLGFAIGGLPQRPAATGYAPLSDLDKLPLVSPEIKDSQYRRFLQAAKPRAFAIGESGASGWATGDWAMGRALGMCSRTGQRCRLYAADDEVVWSTQ